MALVKVFVDKIEPESGGQPLWIVNSPDAADIRVQGPSREEALGLFKELCSRALPHQSIHYAMIIRRQSHMATPMAPPGPDSLGTAV